MNFVKKFQKFQGGSLRGVDHKLKINNATEEGTNNVELFPQKGRAFIL